MGKLSPYSFGNDMPNNSSVASSYAVAKLGAILVIIGVLTSGPLAMLAVVLVQAQPPWVSPAVFVENFHRIQTLPFYFGLVLIGGSILMLVSVSLLSERRAPTVAGLVFATVGAVLASFNYLTQTTFIPAVVASYTPDLAPIISALSMSNPISLTWAVEMWAYGFIGLGTWCAAGFFDKGGLESAGKILFVMNGIVSVLGALAVSVNLSGVFSNAGLVGYVSWNLLYLALAVVFYRVIQRRQASSLAG